MEIQNETHSITPKDRFVMSPQTNILNKKYTLVKEIGNGCYGNLYSSTHKKIQYAIKISRNTYDYIKAAKNEIELIKNMKHHNIIKLYDYFSHESYICIVMRIYKENLYQYQRHNYYINHVDTCSILIKIATGLEYLKQNRIVHRDLKPENIMVVEDKVIDIIIIDFGLATTCSKLKSEYYKRKYNVQSIWYRAPEIFFEIEYETEIDMWSLGCIAYELYWRRPLFRSKHKLDLFIRQNIILGAPPYSILKSIPRVHKYYDTIMNPTHIYDDDNCKCQIEDGAFKSDHKNNTELLDFIFGCCEWDQHIRTTPTQAIKKLRHIRENPHS